MSPVTSQKRRRQPNYEGTPERLPSGKIRYRGQVLGRRVVGPALPTSRAAKQAYRVLVGDILSPPEPQSPAIPTLGCYCASLISGTYSAREREGTLSPRTLSMFEQVLRLHLQGSALSETPLDRVTPAAVEAWCSGLRTVPRETQGGRRIFHSRPMARSTKLRYLGMLHSVFAHAHKMDRLVSTNPVAMVPKPRPDRVEFRVLERSEIERLIALCETRLQLGIVLLGLHGLGPAEMAGLQRDDFDGEGLTIQRQRQRLDGRGIVLRNTLKTRARHAWIPVSACLRAFLEGMSGCWVLETGVGSAVETSNIRRELAHITRGTEFEGLRPYDLRHTFAQRLLDEGVDVQTAAELMRHSTEVFLDKYVRSDRHRKLEAMRRMDASAT